MGLAGAFWMVRYKVRAADAAKLPVFLYSIALGARGRRLFFVQGMKRGKTMAHLAQLLL
jgi:hypothetical protein